MLAAQEMFRGANKVTKPEKALILGFMAGARGKRGNLFKDILQLTFCCCLMKNIFLRTQIKTCMFNWEAYFCPFYF